jgi:uncharacterized protein
MTAVVSAVESELHVCLVSNCRHCASDPSSFLRGARPSPMMSAAWEVAAIMRSVVKRHCPICRNSVATRDQNTFFPFCSERCKLVDLGNWLGEAYRVPAEPSGDGELLTGDDDDDRGGVQ